MNYTVIDIELEQPKSNHQTPDSAIDEEKIISLGICVGDHLGNVIEKKNIFIQYDYPLSTFIKKLTGINNSDLKAENGAVTLLEAFNELCFMQKKYGTSRVLIQWGGGDYQGITKELGNLEYTNPFGQSALNVKHLHRVYCEANGVNASGGLSKSLGRHGFSFKGEKHNAAEDAYNTYRLFLHLRGKMVDTVKKE